jgi:acyl transferase domain-containing protein
MEEILMKNKFKKSYPEIAVIGMACCYPGATSLRELWENILARRQQFRKMPDQRLPLADYYDPDPLTPDKTYGKRAAVIDGYEFDWKKRQIPKKMVESTDIAHWLALDTAMNALEDAGYLESNKYNDRTRVIVGNTLTGDHTRSNVMRLRWPFVKRVLERSAREKGFSEKDIFELSKLMESYYKSVFAPVNEDTLAGGLSNTISGRICNFLDLHGGGYTVDGACSSSVLSVATAATALSDNDADLAIAGGVDISLDTFELIGFSKANALTKKDMQVYDKNGSGFIPGEGAGFVVLKRYEDAIKDGDYIYAVVKGWGISSDGRGSITAPSATGQSMAIKRAYEKAGYDINTVDYIVGHGTGTAAGDKAELKGISIAQGAESINCHLRSCGIGSFKSIVGHTKAASGIGGFITTAMAVNRRVLPPIAGCIEPHPVFNEDVLNLYPVLHGEIRDKNTKLRAGVTGAGFGGINCHITLESGGSPSKNLEIALNEKMLFVSNQNTEIFVFEAKTSQELIEKLTKTRAIAEGISIAEKIDLAAKLSYDINNNLPFRAGIIADSADELVEKIDLLIDMLSKKQLSENELVENYQKNVWVGNNCEKKKVGFLFPGQGSQQLNMSRVLIERYEWAKELADNSNIWSKKNITDLICKQTERALNEEQVETWKETLKQTENSQPAICLASAIWTKYLEKIGIIPVAVGGHSLGELSAFCAANAFNEESLITLAAFRGQAMVDTAQKGGAMASIFASKDEVEELLSCFNNSVIIANINSPSQVVLSGKQEDIEQLVKAAEEKGKRAVTLPVSQAFHSKFVAMAAEKLKNNWPIAEKLGKLDCPIHSGIEGKIITDNTDMKKYFSNQIISKVDFISLVKNISNECDLLLEVGPGKVLSGLVQAINTDSGVNCFPVESKEGNDLDLNKILGICFVHGINIDWKAVYENRLVRDFVPSSELQFIVNPCERPLAADESVLENISVVEQEPQDEMKQYFAQRGDFVENMAKNIIRDIIKDDLHYRNKVTNTQSMVQINKKVMVAPEEKVAMVEQNLQKEIADSTSSSVNDVILSQIEKMTGFEKDSLAPENKLLDDLNLDSIKSATLIANVVKELNTEGKVDPAKYANASISELFAVFDQAAPQTEVPIPKKISRPQIQGQPLDLKKNWVRNFAEKFTKQSLNNIDIEPIDWENSNFLILCENEETKLIF